MKPQNGKTDEATLFMGNHCLLLAIVWSLHAKFLHSNCYSIYYLFILPWEIYTYNYKILKSKFGLNVNLIVKITYLVCNPMKIQDIICLKKRVWQLKCCLNREIITTKPMLWVMSSDWYSRFSEFNFLLPCRMSKDFELMQQRSFRFHFIS